MKAAFAKKLITQDFMDTVSRHKHVIDAMIRPEEDRRLNYWALRSLLCTCLLRDGDDLMEQPQHMWMRAALHFHQDDMNQVQASYDLMATLKMVPSSTILTASGTARAFVGSYCALRMDGLVDHMLSAVGVVASLVRGGSHVGVGMQAVPAAG
ncbi:hypothetical protein D9611_009562 [Ephemerocybe angulata]|uniref:Ribonucleotide reductase large subunit N-terminal domain-containing protein n=1 Tax=Ephemerocybe angulata TaxID=980116 RepID=A0A8H5AV43_9AGAR|nr:hypothetical protein D9611_009562 [Tulosesus angulatus]